ncbi:conserved protein of unknown function [Candidatus Hydrogenisulfobacillus filiaventi]|uniref:Thioredoxin domain-containing protein n=1 Tax=Candidatus Hydrogenisulfobacillus filiaventi TaxID=2707344 RepID=A0A6F8ZI59_9FIRM|nr:conserved protein of unknown function [Candidatus Hydrogenisulfobacillus filiaventi]
MAQTWTLPRWLGITMMSFAAVGIAAGGFGLGVLTTSHPVANSGGGSAPSPSGDGAIANPVASPFAVGSTLPTGRVVDSLAGKPTALARGSRATIVMGMASWCLYCGYEDRWVLPAIAKEPGVAVDIVDLSPQGGIADPGPETPPFSGHDGEGGPLDTAGMEAVMRQYLAAYRGLPGIHVYVAPAAIRQAWAVQGFPTLAIANTQGRVVQVVPGAVLPAALRQAVAAAERR